MDFKFLIIYYESLDKRFNKLIDNHTFMASIKTDDQYTAFCYLRDNLYLLVQDYVL